YRALLAAGEPSPDVRCGFAKAARRRALVPFELRGGEPVTVSRTVTDPEFDEAITQLELAVYTSPRRVRTAYLLGRFLEERARYADSAHMYRLALTRLETVEEPWARTAEPAWRFRLARVTLAENPVADKASKPYRTTFPGVSAALPTPTGGYLEAYIGELGLELSGFLLPEQSDTVELHVDERPIATVTVKPGHHLPGFRFRLTHAALAEFPRQSRLTARTGSADLVATDGSRCVVINVPEGTGKLPILLESGHRIDGKGRLSGMDADSAA
ncbi:MAG: hypothetical protein ACRD0P_22500, partial [Stackebrandtia sp.]